MQVTIRKTDDSRDGRRSYYGVFNKNGLEIAYFSYLPRRGQDGSVFCLTHLAGHETLARTSDVPTQHDQHELGPSLRECKAFVAAYFERK